MTGWQTLSLIYSSTYLAFTSTGAILVWAQHGCSFFSVGKPGTAFSVSRFHRTDLCWTHGCMLAIPSMQPSLFYNSSRGSREEHQISPSPLMQTSNKGSWLQSLKIKTGKHPQSTWFYSVPYIVYVWFLTFFTTYFCAMCLYMHVHLPLQKAQGTKMSTVYDKGFEIHNHPAYNECTVQWLDIIIDNLLFAAAVC